MPTGGRRRHRLGRRRRRTTSFSAYNTASTPFGYLYNFRSAGRRRQRRLQAAHVSVLERRVLLHGVRRGGTQLTTGSQVGGYAGDGWFKMFEFFEVPSQSIGAIGPVASGVELRLVPAGHQAGPAQPEPDHRRGGVLQRRWASRSIRQQNGQIFGSTADCPGSDAISSPAASEFRPGSAAAASAHTRLTRSTPGEPVLDSAGQRLAAGSAWWSPRPWPMDRRERLSRSRRRGVSLGMAATDPICNYFFGAQLDRLRPRQPFLRQRAQSVVHAVLDAAARRFGLHVRVRDGSGRAELGDHAHSSAPILPNTTPGNASMARAYRRTTVPLALLPGYRLHDHAAGGPAADELYQPRAQPGTVNADVDARRVLLGRSGRAEPDPVATRATIRERHRRGTAVEASTFLRRRGASPTAVYPPAIPVRRLFQLPDSYRGDREPDIDGHCDVRGHRACPGHGSPRRRATPANRAIPLSTTIRRRLTPGDGRHVTVPSATRGIVAGHGFAVRDHRLFAMARLF